MNRFVRWCWHELSRERTLRGPSPRRSGRSSRSGVALLLTVAIVAMMTIMVTEVVQTAGVRIRLAANQRDEVKAEALAMGGVQFYRLLLIGSKQLEGSPLIEMASQFVGINADALWQVIPSLSTNLLRILLVTEGDESEAKAIAKRGGLTDQQRDLARDEARAQTTLRKAFLDFDGDFTASVVDEDSRVYVGALQATNMAELQTNVQARLLYGMMDGRDEQEFLRDLDFDDGWELISHLVDWTDADDQQIREGGRESALYEDLEDPYDPKNAPFDTLEEIRLVEGWNRDAVWGRYGRHLTIYGSGKVNVNTAKGHILRGLLRAYAEAPIYDNTCLDYVVEIIQAFRSTPIAMGGGIFKEPSTFVSLVEPQMCVPMDTEGLQNAVATKSTVFRVTSRGEVGDAAAEIEAVFDFNQARHGKVVYWRVQ